MVRWDGNEDEGDGLTSERRLAAASPVVVQASSSALVDGEPLAGQWWRSPGRGSLQSF